jgi:hypothetical protein
MNVPSCAVVVPVYRSLTPVEKVVVRHNAKLLRKYPFVIIGPSCAISEMEEARELILSEAIDVTIRRFPDDDFAGIVGYNSLLKSHRFLDAFSDHDFVLICQTDAVMLSDELETWLTEGFDFIGPPLFQGFDKPEMPPLFIQGANGGLSLRKIAASKHALEKIRIVPKNIFSKLVAWSGLLKISYLLLRNKPWLLSKPSHNEDIFWTVQIPNFVASFHVAPPETSAEFAYEVLPRYLFEVAGGKLPLGCHAWQRYDRDFWLSVFPAKLSADLLAAFSHDEGVKPSPASAVVPPP